MTQRYNTPSRGTELWDVPINQNFSDLDVDVEIRGEESGRDQYSPSSGRKYVAIDTGNVYYGTGSVWEHIGRLRTASMVRDDVRGSVEVTDLTGQYGSDGDVLTTDGSALSWTALDIDSDSLVSQAEFDAHSGNAGAHHDRPSTGDGLSQTGNSFELNVVASGTVSLTSGSATVSTGVSARPSYFSVYLDPGTGNEVDVSVVARARWDDGSNVYRIEIIEDGTSVGDPDIGYNIVRI